MDNFLSDEECDHIIKTAKEYGLESSMLHIDNQTIEHTTSLSDKSQTFGGEFDYWDINRDGKIQVPHEV